MSSSRGFTLVELMVVLVIAGVLVGFSMPGAMKYRSTMTHVKARQMVREDIISARQSAITRHVPVYVRFGTPPTNTNITSYRIHIDTNGDGAVTTGELNDLRNLPSGTRLSLVSLTPVDTIAFITTGLLRPGTGGGQLIVNSPSSGRTDTLLVSAAGMVYVP
ncbi:MAG: prepilin-type N-terminal cleavage/methylation domain-containing protein [Candidatus Eisenbacteria bacterium]|uniref:Prepilin-type N-terminal cleavage/methylation domain-containing protein n=1 Tax=Eiseniibacteriota bacterium TaxID=2212470 RepID=A0A849SG44_UNCEI|nr:prepilin-type N-terminal cleavage/methylation domain-containing protein [Candidatus Eisenbacteria bacterium]